MQTSQALAPRNAASAAESQEAIDVETAPSSSRIRAADEGQQASEQRCTAASAVAATTSAITTTAVTTMTTTAATKAAVAKASGVKRPPEAATDNEGLSELERVRLWPGCAALGREAAPLWAVDCDCAARSTVLGAVTAGACG